MEEQIIKRIWEKVKNNTVTSFERIEALCNLTEYIVKNKISGDFVECGVKKGGSILAMDFCLDYLKEKRTIWLYDVFDNSFEDCPNEDEIKDIMKDCKNKIKIIKGNVLKTLSEFHPERIALLRLDTNFYDSTSCELTYLYPLLETGGILLLDDYGHHEGFKKAVDNYFNKQIPKLNEIDYTGRWVIKK